MTTDRDTLREEPTERERIIHRLNVLLQKLQDEWLLDNDNWYGSTHTIPAIIKLIDAHDNALKERAVREARVSELGRFMSRTEPTPQQDRYYNDRIAELTSKERD